MRPLLFFFLLLFLFPAAQAQRILQIERYGRPKTTKIFIGEEISYRLKGNEFWHTAVIEDLLVDNNLLVLDDRYVKMEEIESLRYYRSWPRPISRSLFWFGAAWSSFAAIGTLTDNDPSTHYRWSDAVVTASSWLLALVIPRIFRHRTITFGKRKRLRILDLNFGPLQKP